MDSCKLWPADKQLNECINIDDMLQAHGRDIQPPSGYRLILRSPPPMPWEGKEPDL